MKICPYYYQSFHQILERTIILADRLGPQLGGLFRTKIEFIYMINNKIVLLKVDFVGHKRTTLNGGWWWGRWDSNPHTEGART